MCPRIKMYTPLPRRIAYGSMTQCAKEGIFMQPMLVLSAVQPGILHINGSFAGEISADAPLLRPSASHGALLLDYRPFDDAYRPMARRLVFSGGKPMPESLDAAGGLNCVIWPGSIIELELAPMDYLPGRQMFSHDGFCFLLEGGREPKLQCEGRQLCTLPEGASVPRLHALRNGKALLGECTGGMYLATSDHDLHGMTGFLRAKRIEIMPDEHIRAAIAPGDTVGHAAAEEWQLTSAGLQLLSSQCSWEHGSPRWPQSPEDTALAAAEAAMAGLDDEADAYMLPRLREKQPLRDIGSRCDLCVKMKYMPPDSGPCIGLLRLEGGNLARVEPLHFRTVPSDRHEFPWQLEELTFE